MGGPQAAAKRRHAGLQLPFFEMYLAVRPEKAPGFPLKDPRFCPGVIEGSGYLRLPLHVSFRQGRQEDGVSYHAAQPQSTGRDTNMATTAVTLKHPGMIEATFAKESAERMERIPHLNAFVEGIRDSKMGLQSSYAAGGRGLTEEEYRKRLASYDNSLEEAVEHKRALERAERVKGETMATYKRSAHTVYTNAKGVNSSSGKNRLYLGNRREVAEHVSGDDKKKKRILDAGVWSWDVNFAWLEGGINGRACFKLKSKLPEDVEGAIKNRSTNRISRIDANEFRRLCENSRPADGEAHSNLWHSGERRLTWFALEISTLLENGYRIRWADRDGGTRYYLEKP